ncbi:MAG: hypothetical protein JO237_06295 [Pseudolabrys sp.]|nr:hypothetical protein [Pseudolabrys sp.]
MKKVVLIAAAALFAASSAFAADMKLVTKAPPPPPSPWDIAFGAALMSDYNFRGITQSAHQPSVAAYFEPRYNVNPNLQFYAGISGESIAFPNRAAAEIDFYGGIRPTFGPIAFDLGVWYYYYPGGQCFNSVPPGSADCAAQGVLPNGNVMKADVSFWEVYGKATYTVNPQFSFGGSVYYSPNVLNTGADGTYVAATAKFTPAVTLPNGAGFYVSGDVGRWFLGTSDAFYGVPAFPAGIKYSDYTTWDIGFGFTWKVFTLDFRYYDTDLSQADCNAFTSDHTATFNGSFSAINPFGQGSNWCGSTFIVKGSFDLTLVGNKI